MITETQFILSLILIYWIGFLILWRKYCEHFGDWVASFFLNFCIAFIATFVTVSADMKTADVKYEYYCKIQSLKNSNDVQGSFVLGTGSVEQVEYYYYYFKDINGYFIRGKKEVNKTVIEEKDCTAHLERKYNINISRTGIVKKYNHESTEEFKIVVPKGTVINKFEIY